MPKIQPINNQTNISFNGTFIKNNALDKTIRYAKQPDLAKFKTYLEKMNKVSDRNVFSLSEDVQYNSIVKVLSLKLSDGNNHSRTVTSETSKGNIPFSDYCYMNALQNVNKILDTYYPTETPTESRDTLIKIIEGYLKHR